MSNEDQDRGDPMKPAPPDRPEDREEPVPAGPTPRRKLVFISLGLVAALGAYFSTWKSRSDVDYGVVSVPRSKESQFVACISPIWYTP